MLAPHDGRSSLRSWSAEVGWVREDDGRERCVRKPMGAVAEKGQQRAMLGQVSELSSDWWCCGQMRLFSEQMSLPLKEMETAPKG